MTDSLPVAADAHGIVNISGGLKMAHGQVTPTTGAHLVVTGLTRVLFAAANLEGAPSIVAGEPFVARGQIGVVPSGDFFVVSNQDGGGQANTGFVKVNWIAIGY